MFIFTNNNNIYVYIHIPKNSGKYIRKKLRSDNDNKVVQSFWGIRNNLDVAHIPYLKRLDFLDDTIDYTYFAHSRNPYDRIVSAFFYLNRHNNISDFQCFCKNTLETYKFDLSFNRHYIHYYPQYLFVCDENFSITNVKVDKLESCENPRKYDLTTYFDAECINIVNNVYKQDFLLFDYEMILDQM